MSEKKLYSDEIFEETMKSGLTFNELRGANETRGRQWQGRTNGLWNMEFAAIELGGETGEALDAIKKFKRYLEGWKGGYEYKEQALEAIGDEIGDVIICADRLANALGLDTGEIVKNKFNKTSIKHGFKIKL